MSNDGNRAKNVNPRWKQTLMVAGQFMHAQSGIASSISENVRLTNGQFHMIFNCTATYKLFSKVIFYQAYLNNFDFFKKKSVHKQNYC